MSERPLPPAKAPKYKAVDSRNDCYYKFIGECYIHGMMDGEAVKRKTIYEATASDALTEMRKKFQARQESEYEPVNDDSKEKRYKEFESKLNKRRGDFLLDTVFELR